MAISTIITDVTSPTYRGFGLGNSYPQATFKVITVACKPITPVSDTCLDGVKTGDMYLHLVRDPHNNRYSLATSPRPNRLVDCTEPTPEIKTDLVLGKDTARTLDDMIHNKNDFRTLSERVLRSSRSSL